MREYFQQIAGKGGVTQIDLSDLNSIKTPFKILDAILEDLVETKLKPHHKMKKNVLVLFYVTGHGYADKIG